MLKANNFKRYAYFSRLKYSDYLKLTAYEYTINRVIDDIVETTSLSNIADVTLRDIVSLVFLPVRVLLQLIFYPFVWYRLQKQAEHLREEDIKNKHLSGVVLYTVDWKGKFKRSHPSSWNDY